MVSSLNLHYGAFQSHPDLIGKVVRCEERGIPENCINEGCDGDGYPVLVTLNEWMQDPNDPLGDPIPCQYQGVGKEQCQYCDENKVWHWVLEDE